MNIYLSEFKILPEFSRNPLHDEALSAILKFCNDNAFPLYRGNDPKDEYTEIEQKIREANTFVALIDKYWWSSTWKAQEFCYAIGAEPIGDIKLKVSTPMKVISFVVSDDDLKLIGMLEKSIIVRDVKNLIYELENCFNA